MIRRVTRRYVKGLLQAAIEADCVETIEKSLKGFDRIFRENRKISEVICHPTVPRANKKRFIKELLGKGAPELLKNFTDYTIDKKRERILTFLYAEYKVVADQLKGIVSAKIRSAVSFHSNRQKVFPDCLSRSLTKK